MSTASDPNAPVILILRQEPLPKARARVTRWGSFDPQEDRKNWTKTLLREQMVEKDLDPISSAVEVELLYNMPVPKSWPKWKRAAAIEGKFPHIFKGDLDNLIKMSLDCMNEIVINDDSQIVSLVAKKVYAKEEPFTMIYVRKILSLSEDQLKKWYKIECTKV